MFSDPPNSRVRVDPCPTHVLLEQWTVTFTPFGATSTSTSSSGGHRRSGSGSTGTYPYSGSDSTVTSGSTSTAIAESPTAPPEVSLPTVYKHCISVLRSLYTLLRLLPVWKLCKKLRRRGGGGGIGKGGGGVPGTNGGLGIEVRVRDPEKEGQMQMFGEGRVERVLGFGKCFLVIGVAFFHICGGRSLDIV